MNRIKNTFYVTTPIYYVTARPHLGSLYSTLLADVIARWYRLQGKEIFFLTGTDEHGQKIVRAAEKVGKEPKRFVDSFISIYKEVWQTYNIVFNHFVRTTDLYHIKGAQSFIKTLQETGAVYPGSYKGWYCTPCETFVTGKALKNKKNQEPLCPSCQRPTVYISEKTYFFKLSAYQDKLLQFYHDNPDFILPKERFNEVISLVKSGLKDLSISRTTVPWGVPFPNDPEHTIYVWAEALCNYITAIGYGNPEKKEEFNHWWPVNMHVIGKDIVRFHAVYWPAFLMAAGLPLPKQLLVHGWIKINKQKMSKSLGNVVDPMLLYQAYGTDQVRYFLLRQIPVNQDGEFSTGALEQRIETDLANDLGNLLQRMIVLAQKYDVSEIETPNIWSEQALNLRDESWNTIEDVESYMQDCMFHLALSRIWQFIKQVNAYFHAQEPWKLAKNDRKQFIEVLAATGYSLRVIAILLWPIMPNKMEQLLASIGMPFKLEANMLEKLELGAWNKPILIKKIPPLFSKLATQKNRKNK